MSGADGGAAPGVDWEALHARMEAISRAVRGEEMTPERAREVLEARARALAAPPPEEAAKGEVHLVTWTLAGETYALETRHVREVARAGPLTPIPGAARPLWAVTAWRGELLAVHDLRAMLGLPSAPEPPAWLVVLGEASAALAVCADQPGEFVALPPAAVRPPQGGARPFVRGLTMDAVVVLDGAAMLREHG